MANILVFAGTSEGRRLVELLHSIGVSVCASVATAYGKTLLPEGVKVFAERLDAEEMATLMQSLSFDCVIDATHPHAAAVTENIKAACAFADTRYLRLLRPAGEMGGCVYVESAAKAAETLGLITGRVLLTTGSKELEVFTAVPDFQQRLFPRILPVEDSLSHCLRCGYPVQNIIAMQGPFSRELNGAMMRQIGATVLVTKESGDSGGFTEKLLAAQDVGATAIVIGRPREETGLLLQELMELLEREFSVAFPCAPAAQKRYFPFFADIGDRRVLVVGANAASARQVKTLLTFTPRVSVVAAQFDSQFDELEIVRIERSYMQGDCAGHDIVCALSGHPEVDYAVMKEAKTTKIPVFSVSAPTESDFLLPQIERMDGMVAGILDETGKNRRVKLAGMQEEK